MERTQDRPIPSGRVRASVAVVYGLVALAAGLAVLLLFVNTLTAVLALLTALGYLLVYTPLKLRSYVATLAGGFPGAFPVLIGWSAATGSLTWAILAVLVAGCSAGGGPDSSTAPSLSATAVTTSAVTT